MAGVIGNVSNFVGNQADAAAINAEMPAIIAFIAVLVVGAIFAVIVKNAGKGAAPRDSNNPPGWLDESSSPSPPPPPAATPTPLQPIPHSAALAPEILPPSGASVKTSSSHHSFKLDTAGLARVMELKLQGAPMEEICRAANLDYAGMDAPQREMLEKVMNLALGNATTFSFSTSFGKKHGPGFGGGVESFSESYNFGPDEIARARSLHRDGAPLEDICRDISKDYAGWDAAHQKRFRRALGLMLGMSDMV